MNHNTDFAKPTVNNDDPHSLTANEKKSGRLIFLLQKTLGCAVSSKRDLNKASQLLLSLESLDINPASLAYQELERLRNIWTKRLRAQEDLDRWLIAHGYPIY
jgi:hypothetical protein